MGGRGRQERKGRRPDARAGAANSRGSARTGSGSGGDRQRRTAKKPVIPQDVPRLPRAVWRDIDATTAHGLAPEVARAVSAASQLGDEEPERARALLAWAKDVAPRSAAVREALGVHAYRTGDFDTAARELHAYRRISGRQDQNHLLADSLRATGRGDRIRELVEAMGADVAEDRRLEAHMVHAGALADRGDVLRAREVLERAGGAPAAAGQAHLRLWYMAAELSVELGDDQHAAELLEAVVTIDPDFLDAGEWLTQLRGHGDVGGREADAYAGAADDPDRSTS